MCLEYGTPGTATQTMLHSGFGKSQQQSPQEQTPHEEEEGADIAEDTNATWGIPENESYDDCTLLSTCQADPCSEPKVDACQLTGFVEKIGCKSQILPGTRE